MDPEKRRRKSSTGGVNEMKKKISLEGRRGTQMPRRGEFWKILIKIIGNI